MRPFEIEIRERLKGPLGMHRKQEWEQVARRGDLREILPLRYALGQGVEVDGEACEEGNFALLEQCKTVLHSALKREIVPVFERLFMAAFTGMPVPQVNDFKFLGLSKPTKCVLSPMPLLGEGARLIRSLFFREGNEVRR